MIRVFLLLSCFLWILVAISFLSRSLTLNDIAQRAAVVAGLVPTGLLLAITLAYGTGAVRMMGQDVLIQQANAVESLSNVDVLCLDKTGTLTTNQIDLQTVYPVGISEDELRQKMGDFAASVTVSNRTSEAIAIACLGRARSLKAEVAFSSVHKWSAIAVSDAPDPGVYVLGAPEMMTKAVTLTREIADEIELGVAQGLRVLLFAYSPDVTALDPDAKPPILPPHLTPIGVLHFSDQLRPEARETLSGFSQAGIELKIISGDNPQTVAALAKQAGLGAEIQLVSGPELAVMDRAQFASAAITAAILDGLPQTKKPLWSERCGGRGAMLP